MDRELFHKMKFGCLGALTPIVLNLIIVDLQTALSSMTVLVVVGYAIRVAAMCTAACIVVWLNSDEQKPVKLFQLGIAAPALLTGMLNGAVLAKQTQEVTRTAAADWFVSSAYAQPRAAAAGVQDCSKSPPLSASQQLLKGFSGSVPDNNWRVVVSSNSTAENAFAEVAAINRGGKFKAKVCAPLGGPDEQFRVVIGEPMTYQDATALKFDAVKAGLQPDVWVWNPTAVVK